MQNGEEELIWEVEMVSLLKEVHKQSKRKIQLGFLGFIIGVVIMFLTIAFINLDFSCVFIKNQDGAFYRILLLSAGVFGSFITIVSYKV